jgi:hypothetical protein
MHDTWVDLDDGDEDLGVEEPVGEHTSVFHRACAKAARDGDTNIRRADTAEPTMVFARPSSMYPLASSDHDASMKSSADFELSTPPLTLDEPSFDAEAIVRRFETVPPVNAHTRVVRRPRLVKSAIGPSVRLERTSRRAG